MGYIPVINATQVWLTSEFIHSETFFLSWYDHEYCSTTTVFGFATIKKKAAFIYEIKWLHLIQDERNLDYVSQFKHAEVFLSKISKGGYIFTDSVKILYVAELI